MDIFTFGVQRNFKNTLEIMLYSNHNSKKRYAFGSEYEHFWYMLENVYPHKMKSVSKSFCINDCDSIQFLSGLVLKNENVFVSYGINDCVSKIVKTNIYNIYDSMITI